jgi:Cofactor assembly of complex C subunit B, CCB2/CCB4
MSQFLHGVTVRNHTMGKMKLRATLALLVASSWSPVTLEPHCHGFAQGWSPLPRLLSPHCVVNGRHYQSASCSSTRLLTTKKPSYIRPSASLERGSGFFVPGLEGPKVRLVAGVTLAVLTVINHALSDLQPSLTEGLALAYSSVLLVQAAVEYIRLTKLSDNTELKDELWPVSSTDKRSPSAFSTPPQPDAIAWSAESLLSLTPATHVWVMQQQQQQDSTAGKGSSEARLIGQWGPWSTANVESTVVTAAWATLQQSASGRIALPLDHTAARGLLQLDPRIRTVILQRVSSSNELGILVVSHQLLAAFSSQDLKWLGRLARYIAISENEATDDSGPSLVAVAAPAALSE